MSIHAQSPITPQPPSDCAGCGGEKQAPIATVVSIYHREVGVTIALCEECGRDAANAIGFMCAKDGGWSKLEPRKKSRERSERGRAGGGT